MICNFCNENLESPIAVITDIDGSILIIHGKCQKDCTRLMEKKRQIKGKVNLIKIEFTEREVDDYGVAQRKYKK